MLSISFNSSVMGRIVFRKPRLSFRNAWYVASCIEASFHGLRPQVRLTKMTPRLQTSFGAQSYWPGYSWN